MTGYSIAGGIASHVSPYIIGKGETYTYTFGSPNTTQDGSTSNANIKNIINEDDLIPKVVNRDEGYSRVGTLYNDSIYDNLQLEYRKLIGNLKDYQVSPKIVNTIKSKIKLVKDNVTYENFKNMLTNGMAKYFYNYNKINSSFNHRFSASESKLSTDLKELLNNNVDKVKKAHEIKAYYVLAKSLNGFDLNNYDVGWTEIDDEVGSDNIEPDDEYDHIYIEVDWDRSYPPDKAQLQLVADSFKQHNIMLHIDAGEHSVNYDGENEGKPLVYPRQYAVDAEHLEHIARDNFSFRERFRYCMYVKSISHDGNHEPYGRADAIPGRMFQINKLAIMEKKNENIIYNNIEGTAFAHELGHTLGLYHGGDEDINYKPNYVSIMNYAYTYEGLFSDNVCNYSEFEFPKIRDFSHMDERIGIDRYNINDKVFEYRWAIKNNDGYINERRYSQLFNTLKGYPINAIDFNENQSIDEDVDIKFYIEFDYDPVKQSLFDILGINRNCNASINDWQIVYRNIIPPESINYSAIWN